MATALEIFDPVAALGKKKDKNKLPEISGPHSLSREAWPPAIIPDHVDVTQKGFLCFSDQFGRMAVVDLRKAGNSANPPKVIAELSGLGRGVAAFEVDRAAAYAVAKEPNNDGTDDFQLVTISLKDPTQPYVVSKIKLDNVQEVSSVVADVNAVFVAGRSKNGGNQVLVFSAPGKRGSQNPVLLTTIATKWNPIAMEYEKRELAVLQTDGRTSRIDTYNVGQPANPIPTHNLELTGAFEALDRYKNFLYVVGTVTVNGARRFQARSISMAPAPHAVSDLNIDLESILACKAEAGQFMVLGKNSQGRLILSVMSVDKHNNLSSGQNLDIPIAKPETITRANLVITKGQVYVASGWAGIEVLNSSGGRWAHSYTYKIPRLAAAGIAIWGSSVVIVGAELMLYDISAPQSPRLVSSTPLTSSIRSMVGAGSFILCLTHNQLELRQMSSLSKLMASGKVEGRDLAFDKAQHKAFVIQQFGEGGKITRVHPFKIFSDSLEAAKSFDLPGGYTKIRAHNNQLLVSDIEDISLFSTTDGVNQVGTRHFDNLAIRDTWLTDNHILATAIDTTKNGFLLVLNKTDKALNVLGSIPLPHNGIALSANDTSAVTIGRNAAGKDMVTIVDLTSPVALKIAATIPVLEAASVVAIQSKLALVGGRGLELVTL